MMMRRFLMCMAVAQLLGLGTLLTPNDSWAQGRGRTARSAKSKSSKKAPPKIETKGSTMTEPATGTPDAAASAAPPQRGPARIDFDDRLIQGQTNKSGAVYLYDRKELKTRSMIRERESFRSETLSTVYDP